MKLQKIDLLAPKYLFPGLFLLALVYLYILTQGWVGLHSDSVAYLSVAENIAAGRGFVLYSLFQNTTPLAQFPFLYPLLLSAFRAHVFVFIFLLNALCLAISLGMTMLILKKFVTKSQLAIVLTAILVFLLAEPIVYIHTMALTEPLFLAVTLTIVWLSLSQPMSYKQLLIITILAALLTLIRYAGILVFPYVGVLLLFEKTSIRERAKKIGLLALGSIPFLVWMLHLARIGSSARKFGFTPISWSSLVDSIKTMAGWFLPGDGMILLVASLIALSLIGVLVWKYRRKIAADKSLIFSLLWFLGCYYSFINVTALFLDPSVTADYPRLLVPLYPILLTFLLYIGSQIPFTWRNGFLVILVVTIAGANYQFFKTTIVRGPVLSYNSWKNNGTLLFVAENQEKYHFVSNAWEPLYAYSGVYVDRLPVRGQVAAAKSTTYFDKALSLNKPLVLVYAYNHNKIGYLTDPTEVANYYHLQELYKSADGEAYIVTKK